MIYFYIVDIHISIYIYTYTAYVENHWGIEIYHALQYIYLSIYSNSLITRGIITTSISHNRRHNRFESYHFVWHHIKPSFPFASSSKEKHFKPHTASTSLFSPRTALWVSCETTPLQNGTPEWRPGICWAEPEAERHWTQHKGRVVTE